MAPQHGRQVPPQLDLKRLAALERGNADIAQLLTNLETGFLTRSFDLMPGGKIIFDRLRDSSDLALIDLGW